MEINIKLNVEDNKDDDAMIYNIISLMSKKYDDEQPRHACLWCSCVINDGSRGKFVHAFFAHKIFMDNIKICKFIKPLSEAKRTWRIKFEGE